jgi:glycogen debranching enzyme
MPGCFALALDGHKRQVDSITSNVGHLLWSGIAGAGRRQTHGAGRRLLRVDAPARWPIHRYGCDIRPGSH